MLSFNFGNFEMCKQYTSYNGENSVVIQSFRCCSRGTYKMQGKELLTRELALDWFAGKSREGGVIGFRRLRKLASLALQNSVA